MKMKNCIAKRLKPIKYEERIRNLYNDFFLVYIKKAQSRKVMVNKINFRLNLISGVFIFFLML